MLRPISEVARLSSNTLLRICKSRQEFFHWKCLKCEIGLLQKASFKTTIFFQKIILTNLLRTSDNMLQKLLYKSYRIIPREDLDIAPVVECLPATAL